ncbi:DMT family transporter [Thalassotalea hakodatensis]|uniref:DMT family transporter n=1 Tax=Thalassotalea hakodatensis TaxID=3030492 RepID=UPI0025742490|nr:DMT family transporter [Thalassotalea hakodatensis]
MKTHPAIEFILLAAIWGASFLFMKLGVPEFGPITFMAIRTLIGALVLLLVLIIKQQTRTLVHAPWQLFIVGLFNTAIPFVLFGWATLSLTASNISVLNATTPLFGALVAYIWLKNRLTKLQVFGLLLGFAGVYVLMYPQLTIAPADTLLPTLAVLLAAACYGIGASVSKQYLTNVKPLASAAGSQIAGSLILVPISLFYLPQTIPSITAINAALAIGILCTGFAYILLFRLISDIGPTNAISVTYLIPVFGIFWGVMILNETITEFTFYGSALILIGVAFSTGAFKLNALFNNKKRAL